MHFKTFSNILNHVVSLLEICSNILLTQRKYMINMTSNWIYGSPSTPFDTNMKMFWKLLSGTSRYYLFYITTMNVKHDVNPIHRMVKSFLSNTSCFSNYIIITHCLDFPIDSFTSLGFFWNMPIFHQLTIMLLSWTLFNALYCIR